MVLTAVVIHPLFALVAHLSIITMLRYTDFNDDQLRAAVELA